MTVPASSPQASPASARTPATEPSAAKGTTAKPATKPEPAEDSWRDTIESVVLAFVLAFLFRTFAAEAFVIPTGSMAPTLHGQHRDVVCDQCKFHYTVGFNATEELNSDGKLNQRNREHSSVCPNCRYINKVLTNEIFTGDRILVNKLSYDMRDPERWDCLVFKFPGEPKTNYIKRLVGLPGEELKIEWGDIYVRPLGTDKPFEIPRKNPDKQRALQLPVYDDNHFPEALVAAGWPERWNAEDSKAWSADRKPGVRSFRLDPDPASASNWQWLRYRHYLPTAEDWDAVLKKKSLTDKNPKPLVITDFYAYNAQISNIEALHARDSLPELPSKEDGLQWVGDLTINCTAEVVAPEGEWQLELIEGARRYRCRIDLKTGKGELYYLDELLSKEERLGGVEFECSMNKAGKFGVSFANVDNRLCLWINDELVKTLEFDSGSSKFPAPAITGPTDADLSPVGIAAKNAKLLISNLRLQRDIYYRCAAPGIDEYHPGESDPASLRRLLQNPEALSKAYADARQAFFSRIPPPGVHGGMTYPYKLHDYAENDRDEFLVLGDNSPRSNDSRLWEASPSVERRLLIGKAFWIYWPHGVPFLNNGEGFHVMYYRSESPQSFTDPAGNPLPRGQERDAPSLSLPFQPQWSRWWKRIR
jgi:signal peptidase I